MSTPEPQPTSSSVLEEISGRNSSRTSSISPPFPMVQYLPHHPDIYNDDDNRYSSTDTYDDIALADNGTTGSTLGRKFWRFMYGIANTNPDDLYLAPWKLIMLTPSRWIEGGLLLLRYILYHVFFTWTGRIVFGSIVLYYLPQWSASLSLLIQRYRTLSMILNGTVGWLMWFVTWCDSFLRYTLSALVTFYYENGIFSVFFLLFPFLCCVGCAYCCFSVCCDWNFLRSDDVTSNDDSFFSWGWFFGNSANSHGRWFGKNYFKSYFISDRSLRGVPPESGAVGLTNTGIYCYQNSIFQCLTVIKELTEYFTLQTDADEVASNPISPSLIPYKDYSSPLLQAYSQFLRKYWCNEYTVLAPFKLRSLIYRYDNRFTSNEQQDNQEFLGAFLDLLHEHLLVIHKKRTVSNTLPSSSDTVSSLPVSNGTVSPSTSSTVNETILALQEWKKFHQIHGPTIVSKLFRGQQLCRTICPNPQCRYVARNFETFMYLPLPLPPTYRTWRLRVINPLVQFPTFTLPDNALVPASSSVPSNYTLTSSVHQQICRLLPYCLRITVEIPHPSTIGTLRTEIKNILKKYLIYQYSSTLRKSSTTKTTNVRFSSSSSSSPISVSTLPTMESIKTEIKRLMDPYDIIIAELSNDGTLISGVLGNFELTSAYASSKLVIYIIPKVPKRLCTVNLNANGSEDTTTTADVLPTIGEQEVPTGWTQVIHRMATWKFRTVKNDNHAYRTHDSTNYDNGTWVRTCSHDNERSSSLPVSSVSSSASSSLIPIFFHPVTDLSDCYELPSSPPSTEVNIVRPFGSLPLLIRTVEGMTLDDLRTIVKKWVIICQRYGQGYPSYTTDYDALYPDGQTRRPYAEDTTNSMVSHSTMHTDDPLGDYLDHEYVPFLSVTDNIGSECALCRNTRFNIQNRLVDEDTTVCLGCSLLDLVMNAEDEAIVEAEHASLHTTPSTTTIRTNGLRSSESFHMQTIYHRSIPIYTNRWMTVTIDWFRDTADPLNDNEHTDIQIIYDQYGKLNTLRNRLLPGVRQELLRRRGTVQNSTEKEDMRVESVQTRAELSSSSSVIMRKNSTVSPSSTVSGGDKLLSLPDPMSILPQRIAPLNISGKIFHPFIDIMNEEETAMVTVTPTLTAESVIDSPMTPLILPSATKETDNIATLSSSSSSSSSLSLSKRQRLQTDSESLNTLYTCLRLYTAESTLSSENLYRCELCKELVAAKRSTSLTYLPEILIFSLKRFIHFDDSGSIEKLDSFIQFPLTGFDVRPWMVKGISDTSSSNNTSNSGSTVYDLFGVCHHTGALTHGHYISYTMNPVTGNWYKYDDNTVTPIIVREGLQLGGTTENGTETIHPSASSLSSSVTTGTTTTTPTLTAGISSKSLFTYTDKEQQILEQTLVTKAAYLLFYRKRG